MSYHKIYGTGDTAQEAFIYAKINEIGYGTKPRFLKKTNIKFLEYYNTLETDLFLASLDYSNRKPTISEAKAIKKLKTYYGEEGLNTIINIYNNKDSNTALCFKINDNIYNFLY